MPISGSTNALVSDQAIAFNCAFANVFGSPSSLTNFWTF